MAIGPIGRVGVPLAAQPPAGQKPAVRRAPAPQAPAQQLNQVGMGIVKTYTLIKIDQNDRVSVRVLNADTDEVLLEAPPQGMAGLADMIRQITQSLVLGQA